MEFILTDHARKRCIRRGIKEPWIQEALRSPAETKDDPNDPDLVHALWPVPEKGFRMLRVVYNGKVYPVAVVTAFFDAKGKVS